MKTKSLLIAVTIFCAAMIAQSQAQNRMLSAQSTGSGGNTFNLSFSADADWTYYVQSNADLTSPYWQTARVVSTNGEVNLSFPKGNGSMFFRYVAGTNAMNPLVRYGWSMYPMSPTLQNWGMGTNQVAYVNNDHPCSHYIDQMDTGTNSYNNCGPSAAVNVMGWYYGTNVGPADVEAARAMYPMGGGDWYTTNIQDYLKANGVTVVTDANGTSWTNADFTPYNMYTAAQGIELITNSLAQGNILILQLDTSCIPLQLTTKFRTQRFYPGGGSHFIVVMGYRVVDNNIWLICDDSDSYGAKYDDGTPKGQNRHYAWTDVWAGITSLASNTPAAFWEIKPRQ